MLAASRGRNNWWLVRPDSGYPRYRGSAPGPRLTTRDWLVGFVPVGAGAHVHLERHLERSGSGHASAHRGRDLGEALLLHFQHQFVVHLHDESRAAVGPAAPRIHGDHGALDDVGGRALHGSVDRGAFGSLLELLVARVDVG